MTENPFPLASQLLAENATKREAALAKLRQEIVTNIKNALQPLTTKAATFPLRINCYHDFHQLGKAWNFTWNDFPDVMENLRQSEWQVETDTEWDPGKAEYNISLTPIDIVGEMFAIKPKRGRTKTPATTAGTPKRPRRRKAPGEVATL